MDFNKIKEYLDKIPETTSLENDSGYQILVNRYSREVVEEKVDKITEIMHKKITTAKEEDELDMIDFSKEYIISKLKEEFSVEQGRVIKKVINCLGIVHSNYIGRKKYSKNVMNEFYKVCTEYTNIEFDEEHGEKIDIEKELEKILIENFGKNEYLIFNNIETALYTYFESNSKGKKIISGIFDNVMINGTGISEIAEKAGAEYKSVGFVNGLNSEQFLKEALYDGETIIFTDMYENRKISSLKKNDVEIFLKIKDKFKTVFITNKLYKDGIFSEIFGKGNKFSEVMAQGYSLGIFDFSKFRGIPNIAIVCGDKPIIKKMRESIFYKLTTPSVEIKKLLYITMSDYFNSRDDIEYDEKVISESKEKVRLKNELFISKLKEIAVEKTNYELIKGKKLQFDEDVTEMEMLETEMISVKLTKKTASDFEKELRTGEVIVLCWLNEDNIIFNLQLLDDNEIVYIAEKTGEKLKKSKQTKKTVDKKSNM